MVTFCRYKLIYVAFLCYNDTKYCFEMVGMVITHNILGMNAQRQFNIVGRKKAKSTEKLSSGFKINRAADDAAGLTISEKMRSQIRGLTQGVYNTQDGVSMCQVADGALEEVDDMLHRLTELAIKASNGTNTDQDRQAINQEKQEILKEIDRISDSTEFNEKKIFGSGARIEYKPLGISDISISGTSTTTEAKNYMISASDSGIVLDGTNYNWSDFVDSSNQAFDISNIQQGTYSINHDGFSISFSVNSDAKKEEIIGKLTGTAFSTTSKSETKDKFEVIRLSAFSFVFSEPYDGSGTIEGRYRTGPGASYEYVYYGSDNNNTMNQPTYIYNTWGGIYNNSDGTKSIRIHENNLVNNIIIKANTDLTITDARSFLDHLEFIIHDPENFTMTGGGRYEDWYYYNTRDNNITVKGNIPQYTIDYPSELNDVKQSNYRGIPIYPSGEDIANTPLSVWIQSGCKAGDGINLEFDAMNTSILGIDSIDLSTIEGARSAISDIEGALDKNNANRSKIGAQQNRLEHTIDNENNIVENITAAESRIRDTDMAKETANLAVQNILTQAGVAMMAQANQQNQGVLQLLQV